MPINPIGKGEDQLSAPLRPGVLLHELFSARAGEFPERTALSDETRAVSYAELDAASSALAASLRKRGVKDGSLVGLCLERNVDLVITLLAILKAGGAYVPVDPAYPAKRIEHIVKDSDLQLIISSRDLCSIPKTPSLQVLLLNELLAEKNPGEFKASSADASQAPAYVIYTSGSTGEPKGVLVTHANVSSLLESTQRIYHFTHNDIWSMFHSIGFDFSVWEIWGALAHGGQVAIVPYEISRSPETFRQWLISNQVTVLSQTPSAFRGLDEADRQASKRLSLRYVVFGGEALPATVLRPWVERHGDALPALINMYGITEATVHTTHKRVRGQDLEVSATVSVGKPLDGWTLHLLDDNRQPVNTGEIGELYIEGAGLTLGYLNRPGLTAERFVTLPGSSIRAYRTGDLLKLDEHGEYHYAGRSDQQLKVRGFRIEAGEVEASLQSSKKISASHVTAYDYGQGDIRLVAYIVPSDGSQTVTQELRSELAARVAQQLPDYMRPSAYIALAALPVTAHGKIDKQQLPSPLEHRSAKADQATLSEQEQYVLKVWSEDIGLKGIGLNDDFFDHGGTSLALIRSLSLLKAHYKVDLNPGVLADGATAKVLAENIRNALARTGQGNLSEQERHVLKVWSEDIGLKGIGLNDDFFDHGGTSLALIRSLSLLKAHYKVDLNPGVLADGATAKVLAENIRNALAKTEQGNLSEQELHVLKVWSEDIGLKGIGLNDDFFDHGGTSLALIRSLSLLKAHYKVDLNPGALANGATAKVLADSIRTSLANAH
ncbi:amino acid adenylation domain-containing protein [Pseudomonas capsici]|uniref:amino acid adenylation domain-containing protein n=1 Tax=Pseudomonas capsici TaxID=2810614 RepID=UPI0021F15AD0|nr:amino acid adenylation domain-containing protein [Pseudomonas capsici]MCV4344219.1 amino acid adenylation domain-containing protein [Pseudomonas capsici]